MAYDNVSVIISVFLAEIQYAGPHPHLPSLPTSDSNNRNSPSGNLLPPPSCSVENSGSLLLMQVRPK